MREVDLLVAEANHALYGDAWYGRCVVSLLADVDAVMAQAVPDGMSHSIWQLVKHMAFWTRYVPSRISGGTGYGSTGGNWPRPHLMDEAEWTAAIDDLYKAHDEFARALGACDDAVLDEVTAETPLDDNGEPMTLRRVASGVAQHYAYHAGQIACVKTMLAAARDGAV
ncbi:MAG: DinB family protein [Coriobacteriia bacterium]